MSNENEPLSQLEVQAAISRFTSLTPDQQRQASEAMRLQHVANCDERGTIGVPLNNSFRRETSVEKTHDSLAEAVFHVQGLILSKRKHVEVSPTSDKNTAPHTSSKTRQSKYSLEVK